MPTSPCTPSAGCRKYAGVPVEASVAAILRPTRPDLPMPVTITRPRQPRGRPRARRGGGGRARPRPYRPVDRGDLGEEPREVVDAEHVRAVRQRAAVGERAG